MLKSRQERVVDVDISCLKDAADGAGREVPGTGMMSALMGQQRAL
jgi:hypothetical protein